MAGLKEGNTYRLISKYATDGETLGVFTYAGQSEKGLYTFVIKNKFDATVTVLISPGVINDYIIQEEGSDGSRKNRKAAKKTRRNRRRSSRLRKA